MEKTEIAAEQRNEPAEEAAEEAAVLKNIYVDMLKYAPSKLMGVVGNIIIVPIYTNLLSPEQYGLYSIAIATLSFLCIIFFDWIGTAGLRFFKIHQLTGSVSRYFSSLLVLLGINFAAMLLLCLAFKGQIAGFFEIPPKYLWFTAILIIPVAFRSLLFQILRAQIKPNLYTFYTILNQFSTIGLAVVLIKYTHMGAFSILASMAVSILVIDIALLASVNLFSGFKFEKIQFGIINHLCWYGMPLAVASLSTWIMTQSNKFIMQHYKGSFYNGIVGVSYNMTYSIFLAIFAVITVAAMPRIINMYEQKQDVRLTISKLSGFYIAVTAPIIVIVTLYTPEFVAAMANPKFSLAVQLVPFLLVSIFFLGLADYTTIQYHLTKKTYINTIIHLIPGILGVILNILFIPTYGLWAVGISTLITNIMYFVLSLMIVEKNLEWRLPVREMILTTISFIPALGFIYFCKTAVHFNGIAPMLSAIALYYVVYLILHKTFKTKQTA